MRKILIAATLMLLLLAANAQAAMTYTVDLTGFPDDGVAYDNYISAQVVVDLSNSNSVLSLLVKNTSSVKSFLTSLAFSLPNGVSLTATSMPTGWDYSASVKFNEGGGLSGLGPLLDAAVLTDKTFKGGTTGVGIAKDAEMLFTFSVTGITDDMVELGMFNPFVARFQGIVIPDVTNDGSALATPTPIPGAAWLLGSGLIGLVGLRRFRA